MFVASIVQPSNYDQNGLKRRKEESSMIEPRGSYDDYSLAITGTKELQNPKKPKFELLNNGDITSPLDTIPQRASNVMNVNSLLGPSETASPDYDHPFFQYLQPSFTKRRQSTDDTNEKPFFKFDKSNPKHVEIENLNQMQSQVDNEEYEGVKIQEITYLPVGGPRLSKVQQLSLTCQNLQFLELFSLKQLTHFDHINLPQLRSLRLLMLNRLTNQGLAQILGCSEQLEQIFVMDLQTVTTMSVPATCDNLRALDIYECKSIETLQILSPALQELTISDGRSISKLQLSDPVTGLKELRELKISGCPKLPLSFLYNIKITNLKKLELVSNAPSAKAYMKVDESGFDTFIRSNCASIQEISLDKIHNISLSTILTLIDLSKANLVNVTLDLTSVEKPKVREALRHCDNLKDWKVEKWYIKKKWTEW